MSEFWINILVTFFMGTLLFYWQERVKKKLERELEREGKKLQADLDKVVNESNVRFSQAYSIRTVAIRDLYKKLVQAEYDIALSINPHRPSKDDIEKFELISRTSSNDFFHFFRQNEILFDSDVCDLIENIQKIFKNRVMEIQFLDEKPQETTKEARLKNWEDYNDDFSKVIPQIKEKLKSSFRAELGIK
ncbi:MAG: hypothetical protein ACI9Z3_001545 [Roseivirga sp.]|jgi:hypothetical protein